MKIVKVTYTARAEYSSQNKANIGNVMKDLQAINNAGINYHVCVGADDQSFIHTAFFQSADDEQVLLKLPSFVHFQQQLKANGLDAPPKQEFLTLVGSSKSMF